MTTVARAAVSVAALALTLTACRLPYVPYVTPPLPAAVASLVDVNGHAVGQAVARDVRQRDARASQELPP